MSYNSCNILNLLYNCTHYYEDYDNDYFRKMGGNRKFQSVTAGSACKGPIEELVRGPGNVVQFFHLFFLSEISSTLSFQLFRRLFPQP